LVANAGSPYGFYFFMSDIKRKENRIAVYNKCNGRCAYCGCEINGNGYYGFTIDHIIPRRRYKNRSITDEKSGSNELSNLLPCCASCNSCKSDLSIEEFRERIYDRMYRINNYSSEYKIAKRFGLVVETNKPVIFYFETLNNG